jgi:hypothetical protein
MIKFQYYSNKVKSSKAQGWVTLDQFLEAMKNPKEESKQLLLKIQKSEGKEKAELKQQLYSFTPCVTVKEKRRKDEILSYTGLMTLDFDKIDNANEFKEFLFDTYKCIIATWLSPSKKGIKALVKIPISKDLAEFKSYVYGIGAEMEVFNGWDGTVQNAVLVLFQGWDENLLYRSDAETWTEKGIQVNSFDTKPIAKPQIISTKITDNHKQWVVNWFTNKINAITDNGHPQVRDNSITLGGYVGSGYISNLDANNIAEYCIKTNNYLSKGVSGYLKTSKESINLGTKKPLTFN